MTVFLCTAATVPAGDIYDLWLSVTGSRAALEPSRKMPNLAGRLETAFLEIRPLWWELGRSLGGDPGARIARAPSTTTYGSDLGVMLAWCRIIKDLSEAPQRYLAVCDDPWLFRQLAGMPGVSASNPPALWPKRLSLCTRGILARVKTAALMALSAVILRHQRKRFPDGARYILSYGHPDSNADGTDAYFGDLMARIPGLRRVIHTDCPFKNALTLCRDARTASLHAWGNLTQAIRLIFARWTPSGTHTDGPHGWLIRRAAALENSGAGLAMTQWQSHCQKRWLHDTRPSAVAWPWENHSWERNLCRATRAQTVKSIGYQHTVIGIHQFNFSPRSNPDALLSYPDVIVCNGPAFRRQLRDWGAPDERLTIGGAFRIQHIEKQPVHPEGPVFFPLSVIKEMADRQVEAAKAIARTGKRVLVKAHPMYPMSFDETDHLSRMETPLARQKNLSAVIYCTGTSGLEAVLMGFPTYRLILDDIISLDSMPPDVKTPVVTLETVSDAAAAEIAPLALAWHDVFSPVDLDVWRKLLDESAAATPC